MASPNLKSAFVTYTSLAAYQAALSQFIEPYENPNLYNNVTGSGALGGAGPYTIGYGWDVRANSGALTAQDFASAGINLPQKFVTDLLAYKGPNSANATAALAQVASDFSS